MLNKLEIFEDVLIVGGVTISMTMLHEILGIIILSFQIALVLYKGIRKLVTLIKSKQYDEIEDVIKDTTEDLEKLSDKTKEKEDGK